MKPIKQYIKESILDDDDELFNQFNAPDMVAKWAQAEVRKFSKRADVRVDSLNDVREFNGKYGTNGWWSIDSEIPFNMLYVKRLDIENNYKDCVKNLPDIMHILQLNCDVPGGVVRNLKVHASKLAFHNSNIKSFKNCKFIMGCSDAPSDYVQPNPIYDRLYLSNTNISDLSAFDGLELVPENTKHRLQIRVGMTPLAESLADKYFHGAMAGCPTTPMDEADSKKLNKLFKKFQFPVMRLGYINKYDADICIYCSNGQWTIADEMTQSAENAVNSTEVPWNL